MIRRILLGAAAAAAFILPAAAADLPAYEEAPAAYAPVPSFTWTGPYVGLQAGYGWGDASNRPGRATSPDGFVVGGYAGYNYQFDNSPVVIGVETDLNYHDADDEKSSATRRTRNELTWSGATRGRVGYAFDRFLVYGAAGLAYAGHDVEARIGAARGSDDKVAVGYTVGGGVEAAVTDNITARLDYRYNDYGGDKFDIGGAKVKSDLSENRVMGGVGYKFSTGW